MCDKNPNNIDIWHMRAQSNRITKQAEKPCCVTHAHMNAPSAFGDTGLPPHSFYPLYPPAPGVPLDAALAPALAMPVTPDILIVPSELAPFAKTVTLPASRPGAGDEAAVLVVNPGLVGRRATLGTVGEVVVQPHPEGKQEGASTNGNVGHKVATRARARVHKL